MIELLAPAGDLEKLKIAIIYGADAVYIGGKSYSLRARASNFELLDIAAACSFAKQYKRKIYVTTNIIPHNEDIDGFCDYVKSLNEVGVNGLIVSSPYYATISRKIAPNLEIHLSTQTSVSNSAALNYYQRFGFTRAVLAREVNLQQIKEIQKNTNIDLEVFIHGGMCSSYSGRCVLSNYLTGRDANRGGCAHSCRWDYDIYKDNKKINIKPFNIASKDLSAIEVIPNLIDLGIKSLKIEGRMKSIYYIASIVRTYRRLIDEYLNNKYISDFGYYENELKKAEGRVSASGFLMGLSEVDIQLYKSSIEQVSTFVGVVIDYDKENQIATLEQRNYFTIGDKLEFFGPNLENKQIIVQEIFDNDGLPLDAARHPKQIIKLKVPFIVSYLDMIRTIV